VIKVIGRCEMGKSKSSGAAQLLIGTKFCLSGREKMRGHRILTLFAVEAAAMFALCAAMSIPVTASAWANPGEHAASSRAGAVSEPEPPRQDRDRSFVREDREDRPLSRTRQSDDTAVRVRIHQNHHSNSHSESHSHVPPHWHCVHCRTHVRRVPVRVPQRVQLPVTGRNSSATALGGVAAVLTGAALLWLSSRRRKWLPRRKSAGSAA
jgi:LPXTG-motif cell wall-anchored protein